MSNVEVKMCFRRFYVVLALALATFLVPVSNALAQNRCEALFKSPLFSPKFDRLYDYYVHETGGLNESQVQALNKKMIQDLRDYWPLSNDKRAQSMSSRDAQNLLNAARGHAVVGFQGDQRYQRPDSDTGFCFGRATYIHLTALKMGLQKESVLKIWAVGPMKSSLNSEITWGYHVAALVYTKEGGWLVIDPNTYMPQSFEHWMGQMSQQSTDQRLRFYVTEAEKFSLYAGKYPRFLMGLDHAHEQDFFKGYFVDMMDAVRKESLPSLGLHFVTAAEGKISVRPQSTSIISKIKDFLDLL